MRVAFLEVSIDGSFGFVHRFVIAVVNDGAGHAAKYGFDHIEELSTRWQGRGLDDGAGVSCGSGIVKVNTFVQLFGDVP